MTDQPTNAELASAVEDLRTDVERLAASVARVERANGIWAGATTAVIGSTSGAWAGVVATGPSVFAGATLISALEPGGHNSGSFSVERIAATSGETGSLS